MNNAKFSLIALLLLSFFQIMSFAQYKINSSSFSAQKDSLILQKVQFAKDKIRLTVVIDSLKNLSAEIENKIEVVLEEINSIYVKKFGKEKANRIVNKQIWKGMTEKMLRASWGAPDKIDRNVEKWGVFTQWYYGDVTFYFKNSKLTDWEEKNP
jgi:hypothetical protein